MKNKSIRVRITMYFALFAFLLICITFFTIYRVSYVNYTHAREQLLVSTLQEETKNIKNKKGELRLKKRFEAYNNGVYISVYDENEQYLFGILPDEELSITFENEKVRQLEIEEMLWFCYDVQYEVEDYGNVWFRGFIPVEHQDSTFGDILPIMTIGIGILMLLMIFGGYWVVTRALRPVRQMIEQVKQINVGEDLSKRIDLKGNPKDELYELSVTYDSMLERLEAAFMKERQFTSDVAHELRTPLSVILTQCDYSMSQEQSPEEYREALWKIQSIAKNMNGTVSSLLQISRAEQGRLQMTVETLEVSEIMKLIALQMEELAGEKNIEIHTSIEENVKMSGDETMLMRILYNLVENGIKYGVKGGNLWISLEQTVDNIEIKVKDDGIGIAKENLEKIWQRFYQVNQAKTWNKKGAGLGLSMVKHLVKAHKGTIGVESELGKGSCFWVRFPVEK